MVDVSWGESSRDYVVSIQVVGSDPQKLLREAARIVEEEKARLLGTKVTVSQLDRLQTLHASLEIRSVVQMQKILQRLKGLASVTEARRIL
jgi:(p)ppGpp synthase/HD superfamily hydrolase